MVFPVTFILGCMEHMLPQQDPNSWQCRLAAFRESPTGHYASMGLQFLLYFVGIMLLHWAFNAWRRRGTKSEIQNPNPSVIE